MAVYFCSGSGAESIHYDNNCLAVLDKPILAPGVGTKLLYSKTCMRFVPQDYHLRYTCTFPENSAKNFHGAASTIGS